MNTGHLRRLALYLVLLLLLAAAAFLLGNARAERPVAQAQATTTDSLAMPESIAECVIENIVIYVSYFHVKCRANTGGVGPTIVYFAAATESPAESRLANRYLSLLEMSWAFNKNPVIRWSDASSQNPAGCQATNCRRLVLVQFNP